MDVGAVVPIQRYALGIGNRVVSINTVNRMVDAIKKGSNDQFVRDWAEHMVENVPPRDHYAEAKAIFDFLQSNTRYANDPRGLEYFKTPNLVLKRISAGRKPSLDCDDYAVTGLSLLRSLGYRTGIRIAGYGADKEFTHVYGMVNIDGKWVSFDPVRLEYGFGWEAPGATVRRDTLIDEGPAIQGDGIGNTAATTAGLGLGALFFLGWIYLMTVSSGKRRRYA